MDCFHKLEMRVALTTLFGSFLNCDPLLYHKGSKMAKYYVDCVECDKEFSINLIGKGTTRQWKLENTDGFNNSS